MKMTDSQKRPHFGVKDKIAAVLAESGDTDRLTVMQLRNKVDLRFPFNFEHSTSCGAVAATLHRMAERSEIPEGWELDEAAPRSICRTGLARQPWGTTEAEVQMTEALVSGGMILSVEAAAIAHFKANPELAEMFGGVRLALVIQRVTLRGNEKFEVVRYLS